MIGRNHPLYPQEVDLRQRLLLDPVGFTMEMFEAEFPGVEDRFEHFIAVIEHPKGRRVIGCVCLLPHYPEQGTGKLMHNAKADNQRMFDRHFNPEQRWSPFTGELVRYTKAELPSKKTDNPRHVVPRKDAAPVVLPLNRMPSDRSPDKAEGESFD